MAITIIELKSDKDFRQHGNLYNSHANQLVRALGRRLVTVYDGGTDGGTVRDSSGVCHDWWPTTEALPGGFTKVKIVPAT